MTTDDDRQQLLFKAIAEEDKAAVKLLALDPKQTSRQTRHPISGVCGLVFESVSESPTRK